MNDDLTAVLRLKKGDVSGLEVLVRRYQVKAVRTAFLILRDEATAEDVVQEVFLRIYRSIRHFDESRPFEPYLLRSVVNAALDVAQRASKRNQASLSLDAVEGLIQSAAGVESQIEFQALKREIHQALEQLTPRQRAAVVMRYYLGMSEKEMTLALDARPGTVKWLLSAARERLRTLLERSLE